MSQLLMENSTKNVPEVKIRTSSLRCIGHMVPDVNAAARRAIAITRGVTTVQGSANRLYSGLDAAGSELPLAFNCARITYVVLREETIE